MFAAEVVEPAVDVLASLAGDGRALELGIGTGRIAIPLAARGIDVHGIDLSPPAVARLRSKPGGDRIPVTMGDFSATGVADAAPGSFALVYLVFNTIMNVTTQAGQVAVFRNAAAPRVGGRLPRRDDDPGPPAAAGRRAVRAVRHQP
jgi:SAM-dependent methyltransferase